MSFRTMSETELAKLKRIAVINPATGNYISKLTNNSNGWRASWSNRSAAKNAMNEIWSEVVAIKGNQFNFYLRESERGFSEIRTSIKQFTDTWNPDAKGLTIYEFQIHIKKAWCEHFVYKEVSMLSS